MKNGTIEISQSTLLSAVGYGIAIWFIATYTNIVLIVLLALVLASVIEPIKNYLHKFKIPSGITIIGIFFVFIGLIVLLIRMFVPLLINQYSSFVEALPEFSNKLNSFFLQFLPQGSEEVINLESIFSAIDISHINNFVQVSSSSIVSIFGGLAEFILVMFLTFYFGIQTSGLNKVVKTLAPRKYEDYILDLWNRSKRKIGLWAKGQLILGLIIGSLTYLGLTLIGIENAFLFSLIAVFFSFIPVIGPILSAIPPLLFALTLPNPGLIMLLIIGLYVGIQQIEGALLQPVIVNKVVGVSSPLVLIGLFVGGSLAGIIGILLATPVVAVLQEIYLDLEADRVGKVVSQAKSG